MSNLSDNYTTVVTFPVSSLEHHDKVFAPNGTLAHGDLSDQSRWSNYRWPDLMSGTTKELLRNFGYFAVQLDDIVVAVGYVTPEGVYLIRVRVNARVYRSVWDCITELDTLRKSLPKVLSNIQHKIQKMGRVVGK